MNDFKNENLKDLLASFMTNDAANQAASDIERGDELLRNWPSPQPGETLLAEVKRKMTAEVERRKIVTFRHSILKMAAVAATILVVSATVMLFYKEHTVGRTDVTIAATIPDQLWEGGSIRTDDPDIAVLSKEIDSVADEISGVQLSDKTGSSNSAVGDVEMQLIDVSADFWKG